MALVKLAKPYHNVVVKARIEELVDTSDSYEEISQASLKFFINEEADETAPPVGMNGKPRMLLISAWMAHEGRNLNGQVFVKDELERVVEEGLFAPPFAGMMDFNHDFTPRGFWYKTTFAKDEVANKWGIYAQGALWAWKFPEVADFLMSAMNEAGHIDVSMSALPEFREFTKSFPGAEGQPSVILHNPCFFTTSLLSVPPGDEFGRSTSVYDTKVPSDIAAAQSMMEKETMTEQEIKALQDKLAAAEAKAKEASDAFEAMKAQYAEVTKQLADAKEFEVKVAEQEIAIKGLSDTKAELETQLEATKKELQEFKDKAEAREAEDRLATRLGELPESVRESVEASDDKEELLKSWKEATDDQWNATKKLLELSSSSKYVDRSTRGGRIPSAVPPTKSGLSAHILN